MCSKEFMYRRFLLRYNLEDNQDNKDTFNQSWEHNQWMGRDDSITEENVTRSFEMFLELGGKLKKKD